MPAAVFRLRRPAGRAPRVARALRATLLLAGCCTPAARDAPAARAPILSPSAAPSLVIVNAGAVFNAPPGTDAVAVANTLVVAVGSSADLARRCVAPCRVLDAAGGFVMPGFHDAHVHLPMAAVQENDVVVSGSRVATIVDVLRAYLASYPGDSWVTGHGWSLAGFGAALPTRADLDAVSSTRPIILRDNSIHNAWVNSAALAAAHVTSATRDPAGGRIVRDAAGEPTGVLLDEATHLVVAALPHHGDEDVRASLLTEQAKSLAAGYTAVEGGPISPQTVAAYAALDAEGKLTQRVFLWAPLVTTANRFDAWVHGARTLPAGGKVRISAFKGFLDGTMAAHTAALLAPYADRPTSDGGPLAVPQPELDDLVSRANGAGFPVVLHAIGDRAVRSALDAFAASRAKLGRLAPVNRIEHLDVVDHADLPRFAALGVVASVQPTFAYFRSAATNFFLTRLGPGRTGSVLPWRDLHAAGATLVFGTDFPVGGLDEDPIRSLFCAVERRYADGEPYTPEQRVDPETALEAYTANPALTLGLGDRLGKLAPGYLADIVVLEHDPRSTHARSLAENHVRTVISDGIVRTPAP